MIPNTKHNLSTFACLSALQKCIRRAMEREAMHFAIELMHSSKSFHSMVCNRLLVICNEDIDNESRPELLPFVLAATSLAREWYDSDPRKLGKSRMAIGNAIRLMCRAKKSREGDHFAACFGWAEILENAVPEIPDWTLDGHTEAGRRLGRGIDYFRTVSTMLVPPAEKDAYQDEAFRLWELKALKAGD